MYRQLDPDKLHATVARLEMRIRERFEDMSLAKVAGTVTEVSLEAQARIRHMRHPILGLRLLVCLLLISVGLLLVLIPFELEPGHVDTMLDFVQVLEPALGTAFFLGAFVLTLVGLELRIKRGRVIHALHELRALAHIVDIHQLTKDPARLNVGVRTASSPAHDLTAFELGRYYDYCSELLSLIAKLAALYVQDLRDPATTTAVDEIETLCTGLSRKIWQKSMLISPEN